MRRPKKTVTINLADYLSAGTYNVKVKSKGTDIRDSADSNSVECVVSGSLSDLTGTKWVFNETIEYDSIFPTYDITYKAYYNNGADYDSGTSLFMASEGRPGRTFYGLLGAGLSSFTGIMFPGCIYEDSSTTMTPTTIGFKLDYIEITGGTDATNPDLIAWLQANAIQQVVDEHGSGGSSGGSAF